MNEKKNKMIIIDEYGKKRKREDIL